MSEKSETIEKHDDKLNATLDDIITSAMAEPEIETKPEPDDDGAEPRMGRDDKGRFVKKEQEPKSEDAAPDKATAADDEAPVVEEVKDQPKEPERPKWDDGHFRGWSPEQRARFSTLPPEQQDAVMAYKAEHDATFTKRDQEFADFRKRYEPYDHVSKQYRDVFEAQGMSPIEALQGYANIDRTLRQGTWDDKVRVFGQIAQMAGIPWSPDLLTLDADVNQLRHEHNMRANAAQSSAETARLKAELDELKAQQLQSHITAFASAQNADGTPKHPHFETVKASMGALLNSGAANTLDDAYQLAVKPILAVIEAERAKVASDTQKKQAETVQKAKKAAPVKASPVAPSGSTKTLSLDDAIAAAMEQVGWS